MSANAISQKEVVSPPRSPLGVARWFGVIHQRIIDSAEEFDLKRVYFRAKPHDEVPASGIHLNGVIWANNQNLFDEDVLNALLDGDHEFKAKKHQWGDPEKNLSDLALCVGRACNEFLQHSLFLFSRTNEDFTRYDTSSIVGPSFIGFTKRKEMGNFGSAMFRGGGRVGSRIESTEEDAKGSAQGPLRMELRIVGPGAAGHPNKRSYPSQRPFPFEMIEALMNIYADGVEKWAERQKLRQNGEEVPPLTEEILNSEKFDLPKDRLMAIRIFTHDSRAEALYGERIKGMVQRAARLGKLYDKDSSPFADEKGPHINRGNNNKGQTR
jgi:hypothetical protein